MLALSALVKGGTPVSTALRALRRDSSRYLKERIDKTLVFINNGDNLGQALSKTGLDFPDKEIISDLKIYSELDNFEEALEALANDWLEESVYLIEQKASILNMVALLSVGGVIAWAVMGVRLHLVNLCPRIDDHQLNPRKMDRFHSVPKPR